MDRDILFPVPAGGRSEWCTAGNSWIAYH